MVQIDVPGKPRPPGPPGRPELPRPSKSTIFGRSKNQMSKTQVWMWGDPLGEAAASQNPGLLREAPAHQTPRVGELLPPSRASRCLWELSAVPCDWLIRPEEGLKSGVSFLRRRDGERAALHDPAVPNERACLWTLLVIATAQRLLQRVAELLIGLGRHHEPWRILAGGRARSCTARIGCAGSRESQR